jgi:hypothetical protein
VGVRVEAAIAAAAARVRAAEARAAAEVAAARADADAGVAAAEAEARAAAPAAEAEARAAAPAAKAEARAAAPAAKAVRAPVGALHPTSTEPITDFRVADVMRALYRYKHLGKEKLTTADKWMCKVFAKEYGFDVEKGDVLAQVVNQIDESFFKRNFDITNNMMPLKGDKAEKKGGLQVELDRIMNGKGLSRARGGEARR